MRKGDVRNAKKFFVLGFPAVSGIVGGSARWIRARVDVENYTIESDVDKGVT